MKKFLLLILAILTLHAGLATYWNLPEKPIAAESAFIPSAETAAPETTSQPEPTPESAPEPTPEQSPEPTMPELDPENMSFYITVNVEANTITVYALDDNGYYSIPYIAMVCSTGPATPAEGVFTLGEQHRWHYLFGNVEGEYVYGQYTTQIVGNILFHSVPYVVYEDPSSLEYWEFDKLGESCSMGCIRLQVKDAKWIYDNYERISYVQFYNSPDPGPLGKPTAPIISDNADCRGWDPTDPDPDNPWLAG